MTNKRSEDRIQQEIVAWYTNTYCLEHHHPRNMILHIPNEGKPQLVQIGLYPGAADLFIYHFGHFYFVEVKTEKGTQSPNQKKFEAHCIQSGIPYYLVHSLPEFQSIVQGLDR